MTEPKKTLLLLATIIVIAAAAGFAIWSSPKTRYDVATQKIGAIDRAMILRTEMHEMSEKAEKYHILCLSSYRAACLMLIEKAETDEKLRELLKDAFMRGVKIRAATWSNTENSEVNLNARASTENIIEYLTGKKSESEKEHGTIFFRRW